MHPVIRADGFRAFLFHPRRSKTKQVEVESLRVELSLIGDQGVAASVFCSKQAFCFPWRRHGVEVGIIVDDAGVGV